MGSTKHATCKTCGHPIIQREDGSWRHANLQSNEYQERVQKHFTNNDPATEKPIEVKPGTVRKEAS